MLIIVYRFIFILYILHVRTSQPYTTNTRPATKCASYLHNLRHTFKPPATRNYSIRSSATRAVGQLYVIVDVVVILPNGIVYLLTLHLLCRVYNICAILWYTLVVENICKLHLKFNYGSQRRAVVVIVV